MELEIKDVIHTYPNKKTALNRISLTLTPGIYGLLGPNGAGKSTLMKIITGNMQPSGGKVLFNGSDIKELGRAYRDRLGYMPQQQGLYNQFTGRRFLWYMATLKGLSHREAKYKINNLLEQMNFPEELVVNSSIWRFNEYLRAHTHVLEEPIFNEFAGGKNGSH